MADERKLLNVRELNLGKSEINISDLEKLAEQGDRSSMVKLVELYSPVRTFALSQQGENTTQAFKWIKKLEELGDWQGRDWLADYYFIKAKDEEGYWDKAISLLNKNAKEGDIRAWLRLAYYYSHGHGVEKDFIQAIKWLTKMVEYEDSKNSSLRPAPIEQALSKPYKFCTEFSFSYEEPRYKLAELYFHGGNGIEQNLKKAVEWLKKAIEWTEEPYCRAQLKLGECYFQGGYGLEQDFTKAVEWFEKAAGCHEQCIYRRIAQHKLGRCFCLGRAVNQDYNKAIEWFNQSLEKTVGEYRWGIPAELVTAQAESGICHYRVDKSDEALQLFEESAAQNDAIANLWLAYLNQRENDKIKKETNYLSKLERPGLIFSRERSKDGRLSEEIDKRNNNIAEYISKAAIGLFFQNNDNYFDADMIDFIFPDEVITFLNRIYEQGSNSPAKVILGLHAHYKKDDIVYLECLSQASEKRDILADYLLGKYYEHNKYLDKATYYFNKVDKDKNLRNSPFEEIKSIESQYPLSTQQFLIYSAREEIGNIKLQMGREEKNKVLESIQNRMQKLVEKFTHTLGNVIFPDTIYQVAERLKTNPDCRKDVLLLNEAYHSEIIIKLQAELLRQRYANTNPEKFRQMIRACRRSANSGDKTKSIADILDYAASRVTARFLNQHNASLGSIRDKILAQKNVSLDALRQQFEDHILLNKTLGSVEWINQHLQPFEVVALSPLWQKVCILAESHAEALLFGYFSEVLFNAFKYADHDADQFLTVRFDESVIDGKTYLTCGWSNPLGDKIPNSLGTGKGLDAILEDLKQLNDTDSETNSMLITQDDEQFQVTMFFQKNLLIDEIAEPTIKRKPKTE